MKKILFILCTIAFALPIHAISPVLYKPERKEHFGVRVNADLLRMLDSPLEEYDGDFGFNFGGVYSRPVWRNLFIQPEAYFFYNKFSAGPITINDGQTTIFHPRGMQLGGRACFNVGYRFDFFENGGLSIATGPMLNVPFKGELLKDPDFEDFPFEKNIFNKNCFYHQKRVNFAWTLALSFYAGDWEITLTSQRGLLNLYDSSFKGFKLRQDNICVGVGYNFNPSFSSKDLSVRRKK